MDGTVRIWNPLEGQPLKSFKGRFSSVFCLAINPDGRKFAICGRGPGILILDAADGHELAILEGHDKRPINAVDFRRDGQRLVSGGYDGTVTVWDLEKGQTLNRWKADAGHVADVAFSPDGRWVASGGEDGSTKLWNADDGKLLKTLAGGGYVNGIAFRPDGLRIVSGGEDHRIRIWDAEGGRPLFALSGHSSTVNGLEFSPDGRRLASAGQDGLVGLWDASPIEK
jgi:WD40 repeat protein